MSLTLLAHRLKEGMLNAALPWVCRLPGWTCMWQTAS